MNKPIVPTFEPAHDIYHYAPRALDAIFAPKNVAVIGATENPGSVGRTILWNLISNPFGGTVFPVNPKRAGVLGIKAYPNIAAVPEQVDLSVVVTPAPTVPGVIKECVDAGVKGPIVISAGFKEIGAQGAELERQILENAKTRQDAHHRTQLSRRDERDDRAQCNLRRGDGAPRQRWVH